MSLSLSPTVGQFRLEERLRPRDSRVTLSACQGDLQLHDLFQQDETSSKQHQNIIKSSIIPMKLAKIIQSLPGRACILLALALSSMAASLATRTAALLAGCPSTRICPSPWCPWSRSGSPVGRRPSSLQGRDWHSAPPRFGCKGQA